MEFSVEAREVARYLRLGGRPPDDVLAARIDALRSDAEGETRPARVWRRFPVENGAVSSGGEVVPVTGTLAEHIAGCGEVYLVCGTLGARFDSFQRRLSASSGADALIAQAIGTALIEKWMDMVEDEMRGELAPGERLLARYSPGYGDFPLSAQRVMLALLDASRRVGVSLTDTLLMVPSKSVSAVIGVKR